MPSTGKVPSVQALILCDHLYIDKQTGKFIIAGTFTQITSSRFPAVHPGCFLYFRLLGWAGVSHYRFRFLDLADNSMLGESGPIPAEVKDAIVGQEFGVAIPPLTLPHAGSYAIDLVWGAENAPLRDWCFEAKETGKEAT
jgi:hypothetical protein